jgi:glycogen synthase
MGLDGFSRAVGERSREFSTASTTPSGTPERTRCSRSIQQRDLSGKTLCRKALLQACGWEENDRPLLVFVGRLVEQKGVDILLAAMEDLLSLGTRVLILGSGHPIYERALQEESRRYQDLLHVHAGYDETLAHLLYAGGDMLLMPSLFEPCGLSQLIALRYGTVPLVRAVGGLADTIIDVDGSPDGNGFLFSDYTPHELVVWSNGHCRTGMIENSGKSSSVTAWNRIFPGALRRDKQGLNLRLLGN